MPITMTLPVWETRAARREMRVNVPVATEEELLEFANKLREIGGAPVLPALLPSIPTKSDACLIATSLNFNCKIDASGYVLAEGWAMTVADDVFDEEQIAAITDLMGVEPDEDEDDEGGLAWLLPEHIGNAADAFDRGVAFTEYRQG